MQRRNWSWRQLCLSAWMLILFFCLQTSKAVVIKRRYISSLPGAKRADSSIHGYLAKFYLLPSEAEMRQAQMEFAAGDTSDYFYEIPRKNHSKRSVSEVRSKESASKVGDDIVALNAMRDLCERLRRKRMKGGLVKRSPNAEDMISYLCSSSNLW